MLEDDHSCWAPDTSTLSTWGLRKLGIWHGKTPPKKTCLIYKDLYFYGEALTNPQAKKNGAKNFHPTHSYRPHNINKPLWLMFFDVFFWGVFHLSSCKSQIAYVLLPKIHRPCDDDFPKKNIWITCGWNHHLKPPSGLKKEGTYQPHKPFLKEGIDLFPGLVILTLSYSFG